MIDQEQARRKIQNAQNNAQGRFFENGIKAACMSYKIAGRAVVEKIPEPFMVTHKSKDGRFTGVFTANAQPDFMGALNGGRAVVFEAKYTTTERLKQDVLTAEQAEALERHHVAGAVAGVCAGIKEQFFFLPWEVWRDMKTRFGHKYITQEDAAPWRVRFNGAVLFLDYVQERMTDHEQGKGS